MTSPAARAGARYDVAILGSGIAGSMLGAILARQGASVLLLDRGEHPRFALGESTVPHTSMMMRILADRFDVPEIRHCSSFATLRQKVTASCGIKRNFGFVYHRPGEPQRPEEATQSVIAEYPHGPESHYFRQDIDAYLLYAAIRYGADSRQRVDITDIDIGEREVRLVSRQGETFTARYLVDAAGFRSPVADKLGLRERPTRLRTHSRSIFTHMIGVKAYDDCVQPPGAHGMPRRWSQGTLHHIFDGGWMWVIPFDNHDEAINPLCSVGLNLDSRRHPKPAGEPPEEELRRIIADYPDIRAQLDGARAVRDWVSTERLQYSATRNVGHRFCLMSHASGAVDALFSRGMANTCEIVNAVAPVLLRALADDDFSVERFDHVDRLQQSQLDYNDRLVHCSYISFASFDLWNAWYRLWVIGAFYGWLRLSRIHDRYRTSGDPAWFERLDAPLHCGSLCPGLAGYERLWNTVTSEVEAVGEGRRSPPAASERIFALLGSLDFVPPLFELGNRDRRHTVELDQDRLLELLLWFKRSAPAEVRELYFGDAAAAERPGATLASRAAGEAAR
jgi:FADH2 O2-dependent halogenase